MWQKSKETKQTAVIIGKFYTEHTYQETKHQHTVLDRRVMHVVQSISAVQTVYICIMYLFGGSIVSDVDQPIGVGG